MNLYIKIKKKLKRKPKNWLVTGAAGFVGSNLVEELLNLDQKVIGIDNFSNSTYENIKKIEKSFSKKKLKKFKFLKLDLINYKKCLKFTKNVDYVLHQAALGSVSRSIKDPISSNQSNVTAFLNLINASRLNKVKQFVYASSSSVYGDSKILPKNETEIGQQLSPYALTKYINELYAKIFYKNYNFSSIGLRYFNVFGKNQSSRSQYAAVIPIWLDAVKKHKKVNIFGDGKTSRDFCYIDNVVQANILAATNESIVDASVFNISYGGQISLNYLFKSIVDEQNKLEKNYNLKPKYLNFRPGDIRHSKASINKAKKILGYKPKYSFSDGLRLMIKNKNDKKFN
tara:strand:+ start:3147 stop:4172 length:1026 start_codon:yes stop_codon:yes gene_type:complete